jgi:hypothetical protein
VSKFSGFNIETGDSGLFERVDKTRNLGGNLIRYQIVNHDMQNATETVYLDWIRQECVVMQKLLKYAATKNVYIAVDLHSQYKGITNTIIGGAQHTVILDKKAQNVFIEAWKIIATRLRPFHNIHSYGPINEPAVYLSSRLVTLYNRVIPEIKKIDANKKIAVSTAGGNPDLLKPLSGMRNIDYIEIHVYNPLNFTHQGIGEYPVGVRYPNKNFGKVKLNKVFVKAANFAKNNGVKIFVGELGCVRWAAYPNEKDIVTWFDDVLSNCKAYGFDWAVHSMHGCSAWENLAAHTPVPANLCGHVDILAATPRSNVIRKYINAR